MSSGYFLICMAVVIASVITGVYYVRIVQIIYFTNSFLGTWSKVIHRLEVLPFRKSIPLGAVIFLLMFLMMSPN